MGLFDRVASFFGGWHMGAGGSAMGDASTINPATGLPMTGGIDVAGNPYGTDLSGSGHDWHHHDQYRWGSSFDDHRTSWHDPFPSSSMGGGYDPFRGY